MTSSLLCDMVFILMQDNPLLQAEMKRVAAGQSLPPLDKTRYTLPEPTSTPSTPEEWKSSLDNAYAQLQHQKIRSLTVLYFLCRNY